MDISQFGMMVQDDLGGMFPHMFHHVQTLGSLRGKGQCFGPKTYEDAAAGVEDGEDCEVSCPAE